MRQLHREFLRAGSDIMQAFTFYASDDKLENRGNEAQSKYSVCYSVLHLLLYFWFIITSVSLPLQGSSINKAACDLAKEVAAEGNALTLGGLCQTPTYLSGKGKAAVQEEFRKQAKVFADNDLDFMLCEVLILVS